MTATLTVVWRGTTITRSGTVGFVVGVVLMILSKYFVTEVKP